MGQNFLSNPRILEKIVSAASITLDDTILEVGPGRGSLTALLAQQAGKVIAIEKDHRLIQDLEKQFKYSKSLTIIEADVLELNPADYHLEPGNYKIVANLPYYITSHFLRLVLEKWPQPQVMVLMIQKEVAKRITAKPPHMNLLALSVQLYAEVKIVTSVARGNFRPIPNVDSAVIQITPHATGENEFDAKKLFRLIKPTFGAKRKQLRNTLPDDGEFNLAKLDSTLVKLSLPLTVRPENLSLPQWISLAKDLSN